VTVEVDNEGSAATGAVPVQTRSGHGLVGMRERVAVYDGELEAGFVPTGGFRVAARLPFEVRQ
jgi:signal transduction histidine kinase